MIETYKQEVTRKLRASRIFWVIVFLFAGYLYFFFQGYYPNISFSLTEIFSTGGVERPSINDIIQSFGIINITVKPTDANILLQSGSYANNEKRMMSYGTYALLVTRDNYIQDKTNITLNADTNYYIDKISLLPTPNYTPIGTGSYGWMKIGDTQWISHTASGLFLTDDTFSGKTLISMNEPQNIGEGYFLSGTDIMQYNTNDS